MTPTAREVVIAVIAATVTAMGAYFKLQGEMETADVDQSRLLYARIESLESRVDDLQNTITVLSVRNAEVEAENKQQQIKIEILKNQLKYTENAGVYAVYALLEDLDVPAWCKRYNQDENSFVMGYINSNYEITYGISRKKYVNSTDYQIFPKDIADGFFANDLEVMQEKSWEDYREIIELPNGKYQQRRFWKFFHQIDDGPDLVCGWEIP